MKLIYTVILSALLLLPSAGYGWGQKGHDIVACIAEANLTPRARKALKKVLDGRTPVYYAAWMDNLQNDPAWAEASRITDTWHYSNVDEGESYETMTKNPSGDIVTGTEHILQVLKDRNTDDSTRTLYTKMLIHLIGDMHCPMHAGRRTDLGGNRYPVEWFGRPTSLHKVWDSYMISGAHAWSHTEWQRQLDLRDRALRRRMQAGNPKDWFLETVEICKGLYEEVQPGQNLSYEYLYLHTALLEDQLLKAGYRLAYLLNDIYG